MRARDSLHRVVSCARRPCRPGICSGAARSAYAGYQQLYSGDQLGAIRYFQNLLAPSPDDLAFRFGLLSAQRERLGRDVPLRAEFEPSLDAFIGLAEKRYARTSRDEEALFYLAQAHLMRARYRVDYDKGMWGAARDGVKSRTTR